MGVDSGLPDFRGDEGFWRAYPPYRHLGLSFVDLANPEWFERDPAFAWGFYGHRLNLYRETIPHAGFGILRRWSTQVREGFVFTSNVDGQFQKAGFASEAIMECHGSLQYLQCVRGCTQDLWPTDDLRVVVDPLSFRAAPPLPACPRCSGVARPNVLMFGDWSWIGEQTARQEQTFTRWLRRCANRRLAVIECGAGAAVPTVRRTCERVAAVHGATLIRINPREPHGPAGTVSLSAGACEALAALDGLMAE